MGAVSGADSPLGDREVTTYTQHTYWYEVQERNGRWFIRACKEWHRRLGTFRPDKWPIGRKWRGYKTEAEARAAGDAWLDWLERKSEGWSR